MKLDLFDYELPQNLIAQEPLIERDKAKLMVLDRRSGEIKHDIFYNIVNYVNKNDVIVINESKVINARIFGQKEKTGAKIECFILEKKDEFTYLALLKPSKRLKVNDKVFIDIEKDIFFIVLEKYEEGKALVNFNQAGEKIIKEFGHVPLPPYIKKNNIDNSFYQTVYAKKEGSVAAPTAGLHFTKELIKKLKDKGIFFAKINLEIGLDTFKPITEEDITKHKIHTERFSISKSSVNKIIEAKNLGGKVISVGTTTTRVLETVMSKYGYLKSCKGKTDLYIYPGYKFKIIDMLITNFHLPKSTLIVLVSAFAGRENILNAYNIAIKNNYRFFSFGDCMLIK